tara:strand:+ start:551 stop:787 length:237 start_codon:yes stop_codon:yes gene_type:complete
MANLSDYKEIFKESFQYDGDLEKLKYQDIDAWDSVGHMQLMAELEDKFEIELDIDDIIDFSSFEKGIEILKKYEILLK